MADLLPVNIQALLIESLADLAPMVLAKEHPSLDRFRKEKMGGSAAHIPIVTGYSGGAGADFATSLTNAGAGPSLTDAAFDLKPAVLFGHYVVDWTTQPFTSVATSSALDVATLGTEAAMYNAVDNFANAAVFSDGSGAFATIKTATNVAGSVWDLVLNVATDVSKFQQNQVLVSAANASASLDTGNAKVVGMNQIAGSIRVDVGASGMTPTATHIIGLQSQLNSGLNFAGIFGFIPTIANRNSDGTPTVTSFNGVTRDNTCAGVAVYGWAYDISGNPKFYGINQVAGQMANYKNAKPDALFINPVDLPKFAQEVDAKVKYDMPSKSGLAEVLYSGFDIMLATGKCEVLAEPACPAGTAVLTRADQWVIGTPDEPFGPASKGQIMVQNYTTNQARFSVMLSGYFFTNNPPATACIKLY